MGARLGRRGAPHRSPGKGARSGFGSCPQERQASGRVAGFRLQLLCLEQTSRSKCAQEREGSRHRWHGTGSCSPRLCAGPERPPHLNGSLARAAIRELITKGLIKPVAEHAQQKIYTRAVGA